MNDDTLKKENIILSSKTTNKLDKRLRVKTIGSQANIHYGNIQIYMF